MGPMGRGTLYEAKLIAEEEAHIRTKLGSCRNWTHPSWRRDHGTRGTALKRENLEYSFLLCFKILPFSCQGSVYQDSSINQHLLRKFH